MIWSRKGDRVMWEMEIILYIKLCLFEISDHVKMDLEPQGYFPYSGEFQHLVYHTRSSTTNGCGIYKNSW